MSAISKSLPEVRSAIESAKLEAGRKDEVQLIGVTKFQSIEKVKEAFSLGLQDFGENYLQEGILKVGKLKEDGLRPTFHFIGALQSNKVKDAVKYFDVIQSIDSIKQIDLICKSLKGLDKTTQKIMLQVNVSKEQQKSGIRIEECNSLLSYALSKPEIDVLGLMTIGSFTEDLTRKQEEFSCLRELRDELALKNSVNLPHLSMGMSDDFRLAIREGASIVRIGSLIFGDRDKSS